MKSTLAPFAMIAVLAGCAAAGPPEPPGASIPFVHQEGIDNWKAEGANALLIRSINGHYYRATFLAPCTGLTFARENLAFQTGAPNTIDRFASVFVGGQHCFFKTFEEIPKPEGF